MAENLAVDSNPNSEHYGAYGAWADGEWGMVLTGKEPFSYLIGLDHKILL